MAVTDHQLWRIVHFYVKKALEHFDLSALAAFGVDETAAKRGQDYVSIFIDTQSGEEPVRFVTPGNNAVVIDAFGAFLEAHGGDIAKVQEVVCDTSSAFHSGVNKTFPEANITVDWFHIVQRVTTAMNDVRKAESRKVQMPKGTRWGTLKGRPPCCPARKNLSTCLR